MTLTPMRYKSYTWPYNPRVYSIDYRRAMAVNQTPFNGYQLQDLGLAHRVMEGEGEFAGPGAYAQFQKLACVFYDKGPGLLIHPLWQASNTYFVALRLEQAPRPDYVRYSFEFWEENSQYTSLITRTAEPLTPDPEPEEEQQPARSPLLWPVGVPIDGSMPGAMLSKRIQDAPAAQLAYHRVAEGESLWSLSARYGVEVADLVALNPQIKNPNLLSVGQEVRVR